MSDLVIGRIGSVPEVVQRESVVITDLAQLATLVPGQDALCPLSLWLAPQRAAMSAGKSAFVLLDAGDDVMVLKDSVDQLRGVAIRFTDFNDGRGYSNAVLLRQRLGFCGPLRAVGDVLRDQLFYLLRCGFDEFEPRPDRSIEEFLSGYRDFSAVYQQSATSTPLFRARLHEKVMP
jgi:uncharacterized protein (DUF934 family)